MVPVRLSWLVIWVVILSARHVLDRRVVDQRLHGRHPPAGIGNLVASPDAEHCDRSEYAAQNDEHDGNGGSPAEAPPPRLGVSC